MSDDADLMATLLNAVERGDLRTIFHLRIGSDVENGTKLEVAKELTKFKSDLNPEVRRAAMIAIGRLATPPFTAPLEFAEEFLSDPDPNLRIQAAYIVARFPPFRPAALPVLLENLQSDDGRINGSIAAHLGSYRSKAVSAVPTLLEGLRDSNPRTRWYCASGLAGIAREAEKPIVDAIIKALRTALETEEAMIEVNQIRSVRLHFAKELRKITGRFEDILAAVNSMIETGSVPECVECAEYLWILGPKAKPALPALYDALDDEDADVRKAVGRAIKAIELVEAGNENGPHPMTKC